MNNDSKILRRQARHGLWHIFRLLVAARVCKTVEGSMRLVRERRVWIYGPDWVADLNTMLPVGFTPLELVVSGKRVRIYGVAPDDPGWDELLEIDTTGGNEPPIPGASLFIPGKGKKTARRAGNAKKGASKEVVRSAVPAISAPSDPKPGDF